MKFNFNDEMYSCITAARKDEILAEVKQDIAMRISAVKDELKTLNHEQVKFYNDFLNSLQ